jgi:CheY-like chemotaxis protein
VSQSVLIVDDSSAFRTAARALLLDDGFSVEVAVDGDDALRRIAHRRPDLVLLDVTLPGRDGIEVAASIAQLDAPPVVVLVSSRAAASYGDRISTAHARGFLAKSELSGAALTALLEQRDRAP